MIRGIRTLANEANIWRKRIFVPLDKLPLADLRREAVTPGPWQSQALSQSEQRTNDMRKNLPS